jgi:hypothetical protein
MSMIESIAEDLKASVNDFVKQLRKIKKDIRIIKRKLKLDKPDKS